MFRFTKAREQWLHDRASLISAERAELQIAIEAMAAEHGVQIYCITVPIFNGATFRDYITGVANTLLGDLNGEEIVLVMSANGRWSVLVGEQSPLTQSEVHQVLEAEAASFFRKGYHDQGLQEALPALEQKLAGAWEPPIQLQPSLATLITWALIAIALCLGMGVCIDQWLKEERHNRKTRLASTKRGHPV